MVTPLMKQYYSIKKRFPDTIVLFRVGDFYEAFGHDAKTVSQALNIVLTSRNRETENIPMAGVPHHALNVYLSRLINKGYKVAICEQLEDPKLAKGLIKRDVVRVITPGTVIDENLLNKANNYLVGVLKYGSKYGAVFVDISTGELFGGEYDHNLETELYSDLVKYQPTEYLTIDSELEQHLKALNSGVVSRSDYRIDLYQARTRILEHFHITNLKSIGLDSRPALLLTLDMVLEYLTSMQNVNLAVLKKLVIYDPTYSMSLDNTTLKHLEIFESVVGDRKNTLFGLLDQCATALGSRELKRWLQVPLIDTDLINYRLDGVESFITRSLERSTIREELKKISDIERINNRILFKTASPQDLIKLKTALNIISSVKSLLSDINARIVTDIRDKLHDLNDITALIEKAIVSMPPPSIDNGKVIKDGYDTQLDKYRHIKKEGVTWLATVEARERYKTGIKNLKIGYNDVIGYYLEITRANLSRVPQYFIRKQTLKNVERYTTAELQQKEYLIKNTEQNMLMLEKNLYFKILEKISDKHKLIKEVVWAISLLDIITTFAELATLRSYTRPIVTNDGTIELKESRHPVLEMTTEDVVPNDVYLNLQDHRFLILTGPNMAGKSTYMRQVALIVIMAQIGAYVPAKYAKIGIVDKIFTRVGASDDILRGQSTFMNEMIELSNILNTATSRSLIILDEIGRGTSTFDGMSIAWAVVEHIHNTIRARTLFATHYHQLIELEKHMRGIKNYHILVKNTPNGLVFVRKVLPGGMSESYGIDVAKLAGLPETVIDRAKQVLKKIETENVLVIQKSNTNFVQTRLFDVYEKPEIIKELEQLNPEKLTPLEALTKIYNWKKKIQG